MIAAFVKGIPLATSIYYDTTTTTTRASTSAPESKKQGLIDCSWMLLVGGLVFKSLLHEESEQTMLKNQINISTFKIATSESYYQLSAHIWEMCRPYYCHSHKSRTHVSFSSFMSHNKMWLMRKASFSFSQGFEPVPGWVRSATSMAIQTHQDLH